MISLMVWIIKNAENVLFTFPGNVLFTFSSLNVPNNGIVIKRMYCWIISGVIFFISI